MAQTKVRKRVYVARREFMVGDRLVREGEPVPEAANWRSPQNWVASGHLAEEWQEVGKTPKKAKAKTEAKNDTGDDAEDLTGLSVADLRALAADRGLTGYSKLKKTELIELLSG